VNLTIGTRCYEHDPGERMPRGGVVIAVLEPVDQVVVATAWGTRTKGRKPNVAFLEVAGLPVDSIDPATVEVLGVLERVQLARAVAAVLGARRTSGVTDADLRDLALIRELFDPHALAYAGGMPADPETGEVFR
jgi:hypothetical protein